MQSKNTSDYSFLPGDCAAFFDGNYISKSKFIYTAPNDDFSVSLGTDDFIRITYPPVHKFKETQGLLQSINYVQKITIENNNERAVTMLVVDQVSKSIDQKIQFTLIEPPLVFSEDARNDVGAVK